MNERPLNQQALTGTFICPSCQTRQLFVCPTMRPVMDAAWAIPANMRVRFEEEKVQCQRCGSTELFDRVADLRPRFGLAEEHDFSLLRLLCGTSRRLNHGSIPTASQARISEVFYQVRSRRLSEEALNEELISQSQLEKTRELFLNNFSLHFSLQHRLRLLEAAGTLARSETSQIHSAKRLVRVLGNRLEIKPDRVKRTLVLFEAR